MEKLQNNFFKGAFFKRFATSIAMLATLALLIGGFEESGLFVVATAICLGMAWEWTALCKITLRKRGTALLFLSTFLALILASSGYLYGSLGVLFLLAAVSIFLGWLTWRHGFFWLAIGILYIGVPWTMMVFLSTSFPDWVAVMVWVVVVLSANDTGGYLFGKWIGGPKLAPRISPGKTWAGFLGGLLLGSCLALAISPLLPLGISLTVYIFLSLLLCLVGTFGDLLESLFKRIHKAKDSGTLIPGHGGVLDRLDAYLTALPLVLLILHLVPDFFLASD